MSSFAYYYTFFIHFYEPLSCLRYNLSGRLLIIVFFSSKLLYLSAFLPRRPCLPPLINTRFYSVFTHPFLALVIIRGRLLIIVFFPNCYICPRFLLFFILLPLLIRVCFALLLYAPSYPAVIISSRFVVIVFLPHCLPFVSRSCLPFLMSHLSFF